MHFRLDDYIGLQYYHCVKNPEYYINALSTLKNDLTQRGESISEYTILYFCQKNDYHIVNQYLQVIMNTLNTESVQLDFMAVPIAIPDHEQMLLMANCRHHIIANSSFSWFGAYFCPYSDKLVYYPKIWFGPGYADKDTTTMCPSEWNVINA